ncbi:AAA family ATPase [Pseudomonas sp. TH03]|uniref:KGGVGR-motif variant AAA ATPase n=1 Tax=Pseudomonas sp. TH03 TaxID=2796369 RepID=UPI0019114915|nr:AAA family ATPase [Pseudomonas sp. TH03]MBK5549318.1 AAA family ATPase [Pseudomonas sp. TH03]
MPEGRIITFYSFKGGVGRTMALANVAYLAAQNRKRVLVMDWDLEAPGLAYYFRGFVDPNKAEMLRQTPGVLNVLWDWSQNALAAETPDQLDALTSRYESGDAFSECVRPIMDSDFLPSDSLLDYIGAGSPIINTPEPVAYEQALSDFSWHTFFNTASGGLAIEAWRRWAKLNYDLVLVDSRTGLADAAGVCTMQLPDEVALCFILNRQNIEGIANVSAAIRANGAGRIALRAMPMRIARQDTAEEIDAKARAIAELSRVGGFLTADIQRDMQELSVLAAENVPFYETLAPFAAYSTSLDLLSFNYRKLTQALLGLSIPEQILDLNLHERVRRRLQGRHATLDYLARLKVGEPERASKELDVLLRTAMADESAGQPLGDDYSEALIEACFELGVESETSIALQLQALAYLRNLFVSQPDRWREDLIRGLESHLDHLRVSKFSSGEEERALVDEIDSLLAYSNSIGSILKRARYKQTEAQRLMHRPEGSAGSELLMAQAKELIDSLYVVEHALTIQEVGELRVADANLSLQAGWVKEMIGSLDQAVDIYLSALNKIDSLDHADAWPELRRCRVDLLFRLAMSSSVSMDLRADFALSAAESGSDTLTFAARFLTLESVVQQAGDEVAWAAYIKLGLGNSELTNQGVVNFYAVNTKRALAFLELVQRILDKHLVDVLLDKMVFKNLTEVITAILKFQARAHRVSPDGATRRTMQNQGMQLLEQFYSLPLGVENSEILHQAIASLGEGPQELTE